MKRLLSICIICFLMGVDRGCLGANPKPLSSEGPTYTLQDNGLYDALGFGTVDKMLRFMTNQISLIDVGIYQENGSGGFDSTRKLIYFDRDTETLQELIRRATNAEFQRVSALYKYRMNQKFSFKCSFLNWQAGVQFSTGKVEFVPVASGGTYIIPNAIADAVVLKMVSGIGGTQPILWPAINRASLVVFDKGGALMYKGDSNDTFYNNANIWIVKWQQLMIARRFLTNGCTGTLTVALEGGTSGMYQIQDGSFVWYPTLDVKPLVGLNIVNGCPKVSISGGAPFQWLRLRRRTDLNLPREDLFLFLDCIGSATWTGSHESPVNFFTVDYTDY